MKTLLPDLPGWRRDPRERARPLPPRLPPARRDGPRRLVVPDEAAAAVAGIGRGLLTTQRTPARGPRSSSVLPGAQEPGGGASELEEGNSTFPRVALRLAFGGGHRFLAGVMAALTEPAAGDPFDRLQWMKSQERRPGLGRSVGSRSRATPQGATGAESAEHREPSPRSSSRSSAVRTTSFRRSCRSTPRRASRARGTSRPRSRRSSSSPTANGLASLTHPDGAARLQTRWERPLPARHRRSARGQPLGNDPADAVNFYEAGQGPRSTTPAVSDLFKFSAADAQRYGNSSFGNACLVAKQLLAGGRGARFVMVSVGRLGHAQQRLQQERGDEPLHASRASSTRELASLIGDLKATPGKDGGQDALRRDARSSCGEFGRTVGNLNGQGGRDHFASEFAFFAGGGVKGGRVIGATDATGSTTIDSAGPGPRRLGAEDVEATVYSALGIDWTTIRRDDPLGRASSTSRTRPPASTRRSTGCSG